MSIFSKLFGGGGGKATGAEPELHEGFAIRAAPASETGGYRIEAVIEKEINGEMQSHRMIRADKIADPAEAARLSVLKAKALIDEQGEGIFR